MRFFVWLLLLSAALLASAPAYAVEAILGWTSQLTFDSNPLRSPDDPQPDGSFYGGPNLRVTERGRELDFYLNYGLRYEQYIDLSSANGFEHLLTAASTWRPSPRTEFRGSHAFSRTRGLSATFLEPVPGIDPVDAVAELQLQRSPVTRNVTNMSHIRRFSERWSLESNVEGVFYDYEDEFRAPSMSVRGSTEMLRVLNPLLVTGAGVAVTRQQFDDTERSVGTGTTIGEAFGVVRYQFSRTLSLSFSGGPAWTQPDAASDTTFTPRNGLRQDTADVTRLVDPSRCVLPVSGSVPAGTVSLSACPRTDVVYIDPNTGVPVFAPSALIPTVPINNRAVRFDEVDFLGDVEDPPGSVTFFGRASLEKRWRTVNASLFYQRRSSTSSGISTSTDLDLATAFISWTPDRQRWRFDGRVTWTLQTSASEQPATDLLLSTTPVTVYVDAAGRIFDTPVAGATAVPDASRVVGVRSAGLVDTGLEIETFRVDLRASRKFSERFVVNASAGWWRQESQDDFSDEPRDLDNYRFLVGFTWSLDPIEF